MDPASNATAALPEIVGAVQTTGSDTSEIHPSSATSCTPTREPSARAQRDAVMLPIVMALFVANYRVYGARKLWIAAQRAGHDVGRDQVARLMTILDIHGATRRRKRVGPPAATAGLMIVGAVVVLTDPVEPDRDTSKARSTGDEDEPRGSIPQSTVVAPPRTLAVTTAPPTTRLSTSP